MDYKARFYSPLLGRFTQPDTLIPDPGNPQAWNRFSYVANRPLNFIDPTGHMMTDDGKESGCNTPGSPKCIIDKYGYSTRGLDSELENYHRAYPTYDPNADSNLQGVDRSTVAIAFGRVNCASGSSLDCITLMSVGALVSPGPKFLPTLYSASGPNTTSSFYRDTTGDPDCSGCGYRNSDPFARAVNQTQAQVRTLLKNGTVSVTDMNRLIPPGARNIFYPTSRINAGQKYQFTVNNVQVEFKWHAADLMARGLYGPSSNSGSMWTAQIIVNGQLMGLNGLFYDQQLGNFTHIPVIR
jgi:hypothetical protein